MAQRLLARPLAQATTAAIGATAASLGQDNQQAECSMASVESLVLINNNTNKGQNDNDNTTTNNNGFDYKDDRAEVEEEEGGKEIFRSSVEEARSVCSERSWGSGSGGGGGGGSNSILEEDTAAIYGDGNTSSTGHITRQRLTVGEAAQQASWIVREGIMRSFPPSLQQQEQQHHSTPKRSIFGTRVDGERMLACVSQTPWASGTFSKIGSMMETKGFDQQAMAELIDDACDIATSDSVLKQVEMKLGNGRRAQSEDTYGNGGVSSRLSLKSSEHRSHEDNVELIQRNERLEEEVQRLKEQLRLSEIERGPTAAAGGGERKEGADTAETSLSDGEGDAQKGQQQATTEENSKKEKERVEAQEERWRAQCEAQAEAQERAGKSSWRSWREAAGIIVTVVGLIVKITIFILRYL